MWSMHPTGRFRTGLSCHYRASSTCTRAAEEVLVRNHVIDRGGAVIFGLFRRALLEVRHFETNPKQLDFGTGSIWFDAWHRKQKQRWLKVRPTWEAIGSLKREICLFLTKLLRKHRPHLLNFFFSSYGTGTFLTYSDLIDVFESDCDTCNSHLTSSLW